MNWKKTVLLPSEAFSGFKMAKICVSGRGRAPDLAGELTALPNLKSLASSITEI